LKSQFIRGVIRKKEKEKDGENAKSKNPLLLGTAE
jgi:hypothetical protein